MKIVSEYKELEGQTFNTIRECADAEAAVAAKRVEAQKAEVSKKKRELAKIIDEAEVEVIEAYKKYEDTKKEVQKLLEESNEQMTKLIKDASDSVKTAEQKRRDAILNYTSTFGPYQRVYSGDRAIKEYERVEKQFSNTLSDIINAFITN